MSVIASVIKDKVIIAVRTDPERFRLLLCDPDRNPESVFTLRIEIDDDNQLVAAVTDDDGEVDNETD